MLLAPRSQRSLAEQVLTFQHTCNITNRRPFAPFHPTNALTCHA